MECGATRRGDVMCVVLARKLAQVFGNFPRVSSSEGILLQFTEARRSREGRPRGRGVDTARLPPARARSASGSAGRYTKVAVFLTRNGVGGARVRKHEVPLRGWRNLI